jgi:hypothetical protein
MSKLYSIENLLVGKQYNSLTARGEIVEAEPSDKVYFGNGINAYLVRIREHGMLKDKYRFIAVRVGE